MGKCDRVVRWTMANPKYLGLDLPGEGKRYCSA